MSGVMDRRPDRISLRRLCGMRVALAAASCVIAIGSKNSVRRMIPGWMREAVGFMGLAWDLVVIDDLDLLGVLAGPTEADAPLVIDADGVLATAIALQGLQPVAWR